MGPQPLEVVLLASEFWRRERVGEQVRGILLGELVVLQESLEAFGLLGDVERLELDIDPRECAESTEYREILHRKVNVEYVVGSRPAAGTLCKLE